MPAKSPLRQLSDIISASVDQIESHFAKSNLEYPSLDAPFNPTLPAEGLTMSPEVVQAAQLVVAACGQLSTIVQMPALTLFETVGGFHVASAMRVACEGNMVEILREAGPSGLHSKDIGIKTGLDPVKISRVLRLLSTYHIFRELSTDVFTNNRISSMMDSLKSVDVLQSNPEDKYVGTPGIGALMGHTSDEVFKASAFMTEALFDPITGHSDAPEHAALMMAFKTKKPMWEWIEEPENAFRFKRFSAAMDGTSRAEPPNSILQGFDWSQLAPQSVIVDVGGGIGSTTINIARKYTQFEYVVQDRPAVIEHAKEYWQRELPATYDNGSVKLQGHDFFTLQPIRNASVFILRLILHDHGRTLAIKILKQLRDVATPTTKLMIVDQMIPYASNDGAALSIGKNIPGAEQVKPPQPLLPNMGKANAFPYIADFQMYVALNGEERTLGGFLEVTRSAGWEIKQIFSIPGSMLKQIIAVPAILS